MSPGQPPSPPPMPRQHSHQPHQQRPGPAEINLWDDPDIARRFEAFNRAHEQGRPDEQAQQRRRHQDPVPDRRGPDPEYKYYTPSVRNKPMRGPPNPPDRPNPNDREHAPNPPNNDDKFAEFASDIFDRSVEHDMQYGYEPGETFDELARRLHIALTQGPPQHRPAAPNPPSQRGKPIRLPQPSPPPIPLNPVWPGMRPNNPPRTSPPLPFPPSNPPRPCYSHHGPERRSHASRIPQEPDPDEPDYETRVDPYTKAHVTAYKGGAKPDWWAFGERVVEEEED